MVDHTGQTYLDFEDAGEVDATIFAQKVQNGFHDLCDEALVLEERDRLDDAAQAYQRALELKPDHPTLHFDLRNVLIRLHRSNETIEHFEEAVRLDPDVAMAWHNLGSVHAHLGDLEEAEVALRRALALVPTYANSHFTMAEVLHNRGQAIEAERHHSAYLEFSKSDCLHATRDQVLRVVHVEDAE